MDLLSSTEALRYRIGQGLELAGACAVTLLGLVMLGR
jgi:hypothetical protein